MESQGTQHRRCTQTRRKRAQYHTPSSYVDLKRSLRLRKRSDLKLKVIGSILPCQAFMSVSARSQARVPVLARFARLAAESVPSACVVDCPVELRREVCADGVTPTMWMRPSTPGLHTTRPVAPSSSSAWVCDLKACAPRQAAIAPRTMLLRRFHIFRTSTYSRSTRSEK